MDCPNRDVPITKRIGVIVPSSNTNLEPDMLMLAPPGVGVHFTRSGGYDVDAIPDEKQMQQYSDAGIDAQLDLLKDCKPNAILYGCTSATLAQGPEYDAEFNSRIFERTGITGVTAASALTFALKALGVRKFAFTSPYVPSLNNLAVTFLEASGFECVGRQDTDHPWSNEEVAAATPETAIQMACSADTAEAEVVVISCTDFRATETIAKLEKLLNKPVVTSNQAMMAWALATIGARIGDSRIGNHKLMQAVHEAAS